MPKNKVFVIHDSDYRESHMLVAAPNYKEAKRVGFYGYSSEYEVPYAEVRMAQANEHYFYHDMDESYPYVHVTGKGPVYTDHPTGEMSFEEFEEELKAQGRYKLVNEEDDQ